MPGSVVLLSGRSFSGKSSLAGRLAEALPATVVSHDAINAERGLHGGEGVPVDEWLATNRIAQARARLLLAADRAVVVDDTSSPRFLRDGWRELAAEAQARFVLVHVDVATSVLLQRLAENRRDRRRPDVADAVMAEHLAAFEPPEADEPHVRVTGATSLDEAVAAVRTALPAARRPAGSRRGWQPS